MSTSPLCRWSEIAEARQFNQAAMFDQPLAVTKTSHLHLCDLIANIPSCFQRVPDASESLRAQGKMLNVWSRRRG